MTVPVWIIGALIGAVVGFLQGALIVQLFNKRAAQGQGKPIPRFFPIIEAVALAVVGGLIAQNFFGGN